MTPREPCKWKSIWFGILVLGFLGWAWLVSKDSLCAIGIRTASDWWVAAQFNGEVCLASKPDISPWGGPATTTVINVHGTGGSPEYMVWWDEFTPYGLSAPHRLLG
jgi:hypothetical protein